MKLIHGDCLAEMKTIPHNSIDLTLTSPPYDNLRNYGGIIDGWSFEKFQGIAKELYRITKEGGVVVWIVADATINGSETGTSFKQALFFKECGFRLHDTMIWQKSTSTDTGSLSVRYGNNFEYMFVLSKGKPRCFNPIKDRKNKRAGVKKHGTIRLPNGLTRKMSSQGKSIPEYGQRWNVWSINEEKSNSFGHPAVFSEALANDHILSWSNEGDIVLDCFMGSGTTGKMAIQNNRDFIGIEINEEYFKIAEKRINDAISEQELRLF